MNMDFQVCRNFTLRYIKALRWLSQEHMSALLKKWESLCCSGCIYVKTSNWSLICFRHVFFFLPPLPLALHVGFHSIQWTHMCSSLITQKVFGHVCMLRKRRGQHYSKCFHVRLQRLTKQSWHRHVNKNSPSHIKTRERERWCDSLGDSGLDRKKYHENIYRTIIKCGSNSWREALWWISISFVASPAKLTRHTALYFQTSPPSPAQFHFLIAPRFPCTMDGSLSLWIHTGFEQAVTHTHLCLNLFCNDISGCLRGYTSQQRNFLPRFIKSNSYFWIFQAASTYRTGFLLLRTNYMIIKTTSKNYISSSFLGLSRHTVTYF